MLRSAEAVTRDSRRAASSPAPAHSDRVKRLTLVTCILASGIAFLDATAVNLALPALARDFGGGPDHPTMDRQRMALVALVRRERAARDPMLPIELFARRNLAVGNLQTLAMYAGLSVLLLFWACSSRSAADGRPHKRGS